MPEALQLLGHLVLQAQVLRQPRHGGETVRRGAPLQPGGDAGIGQLGVIAHAGHVEIGPEQVPGGVHPEVHHHREPVLAAVERREASGKVLGQHGEDLGRRVDRGGVPAGVSVQGGVLLHQGVHVGQRHQDPGGPARQGLGDGELVQVAGAEVVDGSPGERPQVPGPGGAGGPGPGLDGFQLGQGRRPEIHQQATVEHRRPGDALQDGAVVPVEMHGRGLRPGGWSKRSPYAHEFCKVIPANASRVPPAPSGRSVPATPAAAPVPATAAAPAPSPVRVDAAHGDAEKHEADQDPGGEAEGMARCHTGLHEWVWERSDRCPDGWESGGPVQA